MVRASDGVVVRRLGVAGAALIVLSAASFAGLLFLGTTLRLGPAGTGLRVLVGLLYLGMVGGATAGHVCGLVAFVRLKGGRERAIGFASAAAGVFLLLSCTLLNVFASPVFQLLTTGVVR